MLFNPRPLQMPNYRFLLLFAFCYIAMVRAAPTEPLFAAPAWPPRPLRPGSPTRSAPGDRPHPPPPAAPCSQYAFFALLYMAQPRSCITRVSHFLHALWFSVQTSATIGCVRGFAVRPRRPLRSRAAGLRC